MLAVAACGGGGVSVEDLPVELEDAQCDYLVRCQGVVDSATCHDAYDINDASYQTILNGVDDGTIEYDEDAAGRCRDYYLDLECTFQGLNLESPCNDVFVGTVPTGGACTIDLQCAGAGECVPTDANCDPSTTCCAGTCEASTEMVSSSGGPCNDDIHVCGENLYCKATGETSGTCEPLITEEGAPCEGSLGACANPMYCNIDLFGTGAPSVCTRPAASGAACDLDDLLPCADERDYCDGSTCVRNVTPGGTCGEGIACVGYASCIDGICVAEVPLGGACGADGGPDCAGSLECINGTCQLEPDGLVCLQ